MTNHKPLSPETVAQTFHEAYERLAPDFGYATRKASAVPWADVPEPNRSLMVAVAGEVLATLDAARAEAGRLDVGDATALELVHSRLEELADDMDSVDAGAVFAIRLRAAWREYYAALAAQPQPAASQPSPEPGLDANGTRCPHCLGPAVRTTDPEYMRGGLWGHKSLATQPSPEPGLDVEFLMRLIAVFRNDLAYELRPDHVREQIARLAAKQPDKPVIVGMDLGNGHDWTPGALHADGTRCTGQSCSSPAHLGQPEVDRG